MSAAEVIERVEPFVRTLRKAHPGTPIVMAEDRLYSNRAILPGPRKSNDENHAALKAAYDQLLANGIKGLYYFRRSSSLAMMARAPLTDHTLRTSASFRMADAFTPVLTEALKQASEK